VKSPATRQRGSHRATGRARCMPRRPGRERSPYRTLANNKLAHHLCLHSMYTRFITQKMPVLVLPDVLLLVERAQVKRLLHLLNGWCVCDVEANNPHFSSIVWYLVARGVPVVSRSPPSPTNTFSSACRERRFPSSHQCALFLAQFIIQSVFDYQARR
jgi:hypothetical protein